MAGRFSADEWAKIRAELKRDPAAYGMPEGGREGSLVFASFNIRKLGAIEDRGEELDFLATFCAKCDFIAIQEVMDDTKGVTELRDRMEAKVAARGEFRMVISDIAGSVPGESGMAERLAFMYRQHRVARLDMASDINIDRTTVLDTLFDNLGVITKSRKDFEKKMADHAAGRRASKPAYATPVFLSFIRSPHVVAFEIPAANGQKPVTFAAVNAHLIYGKQAERDAEFRALVSWLVNRLEDQDKMTVNNFILLGDLNLNFDKPVKDRAAIEAWIKTLNQSVFGDAENRRVYFPFIDNHLKTGKTIRTNARLNQTFDQIAFFLGASEADLPNDGWTADFDADDRDGFAYDVFNFADLFARALRGKPYLRLTKAEKSALGEKFEHSVSDHMPIWVRLPRPGYQEI